MSTLTAEERRVKVSGFADGLAEYLNQQRGFAAEVVTRDNDFTATRYGVKIFYEDGEMDFSNTVWFDEKHEKYRYRGMGKFYISIGGTGDRLVVHEKSGEFQNAKFLDKYNQYLVSLKTERRIREQKEKGLARALVATGGEYYQRIGLFTANPKQSGTVEIKANLDPESYRVLVPVLSKLGMNTEGEFYDEMFEEIILSAVRAWIASGKSDIQDICDTVFQDTIPEIKAIFDGGHYGKA